MFSQQVRHISIRSVYVFASALIALALSHCTPTQIEISPEIDVNPPGTQHEITAKVTDAQGRPVYHSPVEWLLPRSEHAVGDIVSGDDDSNTAPRHPKRTNTYAKTHTNFDGEAKITITSPLKGKTSIVAVAKGIEDQDQHKAYAVKYWDYLNWQFPPDATNLAGTPHHMNVRVQKPYSDTHPVRYKITKDSIQKLRQENVPNEIPNQLDFLRHDIEWSDKPQVYMEDSFYTNSEPKD